MSAAQIESQKRARWVSKCPSYFILFTVARLNLWSKINSNLVDFTRLKIFLLDYASLRSFRHRAKMDILRSNSSSSSGSFNSLASNSNSGILINSVSSTNNVDYTRRSTDTSLNDSSRDSIDENHYSDPLPTSSSASPNFVSSSGRKSFRILENELEEFDEDLV